jgi:SAM-dependent methyltransferase
MTADLPDPGDCADRLAELAGPGPALELGIGTGRVALPLAARGVEVHGIDASAAMVERLRAKPGGEAIPVTFGDFADVPVEPVEGGYPPDPTPASGSTPGPSAMPGRRSWT